MDMIRYGLRRYCLVLSLLLALPCAVLAQQASTSILHAPQATKLLPDSVFFAGKSASTQLRNSAGLRFADGQYTLAVLVDTSGYSTGVQEKYQGYLLSEVPLEIEGHALPAGAYGVGFVGSSFHVMDIGSHDLFLAAATHDEQMRRPVPLQILPGAAASEYRLCFGRNCVSLRRGR